MRKLALIVCILIMASTLLTGCGTTPKEAPKTKSTDAEVETVILKAATNNPKTSGHYKGLEIFKKLVEERTNGVVQVELYSDAVLGDEEQMAEGMKMGTVDAMMAASAKYANFVPEMDLYSPPYTFKSWEHMQAVVKSDVNEKIANAVKERRGDIYLGVFTDGVRNVFTRKPVNSLDELKGLKLRTMTGPNETNSWKALGTNPTPLAYTELYAALESGVVDGAENSMAAILNMKFYESCKYVYKTQHNYLTLPFFISAKAIEKIPADLREIVIQAGMDTCKEQIDWAIENDKKAEEILVTQHGITIVEMSKEDKEKALELCNNVQNENAARIKMEADLEKIREIGKNY
ncbi:tripartite ATP-independent transporter DctP family solute receptor [Anaerosolibacter carboniphilus]|uniref:Tripartite ATP-independent transporter DctP family solute receptor n=1 Tax=Anaerosolibacter carboniphilus TaxID=1417629 RepID=A0A841KZ78_9FIRM|nr:TRAP transporter substrate-binding protein [Anaerosolibacter carboniphilus]MBB6217280.1 tripartite ATP-independent transporter DctP family solute receptor [Anaerosolibacter carboniphilus]